MMAHGTDPDPCSCLDPGSVSCRKGALTFAPGEHRPLRGVIPQSSPTALDLQAQPLMLFVPLHGCWWWWWVLAGGEDEKPYAYSYSPSALNKGTTTVSLKPGLAL